MCHKAFFVDSVQIVQIVYRQCRQCVDSVDTDHHAGGDGDAPAAVGVGHDVPVADAEEGDGYQPHRVQQVGVLLVMVPAWYMVQVHGTWYKVHGTGWRAPRHGTCMVYGTWYMVLGTWLACSIHNTLEVFLVTI